MEAAGLTMTLGRIRNDQSFLVCWSILRFPRSSQPWESLSHSTWLVSEGETKVGNPQLKREPGFRAWRLSARREEWKWNGEASGQWLVRSYTAIELLAEWVGRVTDRKRLYILTFNPHLEFSTLLAYLHYYPLILIIILRSPLPHLP